MVIRAYLVNIFKALWAYNICRYIYWVHYLTMYFLFSQVVWLTWSHWGWRHQISRCWSWNRKLQHEIESLQGNTNYLGKYNNRLTNWGGDNSYGPNWTQNSCNSCCLWYSNLQLQEFKTLCISSFNLHLLKFIQLKRSYGQVSMEKINCFRGLAYRKVVST